jgi:uncharacterized protein YkwD
MCNNGVSNPSGANMTKAAGLMLALAALTLAGCGGRETLPEQPAFYVNMASPTAKLDAAMAASMISGYRRNNGLGAVEVDPLLMKAAATQSQAMAARNKLDHNVAGALDKRIRASGFDAARAVENVSAGYHTLAEAFSGWRDSPPHKANMLASGMTKMGIAAVYAPNTKYKVFWTLILAAPDAR